MNLFISGAISRTTDVTSAPELPSRPTIPSQPLTSLPLENSPPALPAGTNRPLFRSPRRSQAANSMPKPRHSHGNCLKIGGVCPIGCLCEIGKSVDNRWARNGTERGSVVVDRVRLCLVVGCGFVRAESPAASGLCSEHVLAHQSGLLCSVQRCCCGGRCFAPLCAR